MPSSSASSADFNFKNSTSDCGMSGWLWQLLPAQTHPARQNRLRFLLLVSWFPHSINQQPAPPPLRNCPEKIETRTRRIWRARYFRPASGRAAVTRHFFGGADCPNPQRVASQTRLGKSHAPRFGAAAASWDNSRSGQSRPPPVALCGCDNFFCGYHAIVTT